MNFEFVIPTYKRPHQLMMTINCIYSQTVDNWRISVVADADYEGYSKVVDYFKGDDRIRFHTLEGGPNNDWGHTPRIYGMQNAKEGWLIMTGDDNYYFPCFLEYFNRCVDDKTNFIFCDFYHNYTNYIPETAELRRIDTLDGNSRYEGLDVGCYATRSELAKKIPFQKHLHWADGQFAADYWSAFCREEGAIKKVNHRFYVHN